MTTNMIDINLVLWNGADWIEACLNSLMKQTYQNWRLHVVDNGSNDASVALLTAWREKHPTYAGVILYHDTNIGFSAAHNELLRATAAPLVLILNQDSILTPTYLADIVPLFKQDEQLGSASGLLINMSGTGEHPILSTTIDAAGLTIFRSHRVVDRLHGQPVVNAGEKIQSIFGIPAAVAVYRRAALENVAIYRNNRVQYFDSDFFSYKEDVDLAYRLQLAGWGSSLYPLVVAYHARGVKSMDQTTATGIKQIILARWHKSANVNYLSYRNHLLFLQGTCAFSLVSPTGLAVLWYEIGKIVVLLLTEPITLRAWWDVWRLRAHSKEKRQEIRHRTFLPQKVARYF